MYLYGMGFALAAPYGGEAKALNRDDGWDYISYLKAATGSSLAA